MKDKIIEAQTTAVYKLADSKYHMILEADFLEDVLQTALQAMLKQLPELGTEHEPDHAYDQYEKLLNMRDE